MIPITMHGIKLQEYEECFKEICNTYSILSNASASSSAKYNNKIDTMMAACSNHVR